MKAKKTVREREAELRALMATEGGRGELDEVAARPTLAPEEAAVLLSSLLPSVLESQRRPQGRVGDTRLVVRVAIAVPLALAALAGCDLGHGAARGHACEAAIDKIAAAARMFVIDLAQQPILRPLLRPHRPSLR